MPRTSAVNASAFLEKQIRMKMENKVMKGRDKAQCSLPTICEALDSIPSITQRNKVLTFSISSKY